MLEDHTIESSSDDVTKNVYCDFLHFVTMSKKNFEKRNNSENLTKSEQIFAEIEPLSVKILSYIFCNFSVGSHFHKPMQKSQKMYGKIFTLNSSYLNRVLLNFPQIFTTIHTFSILFKSGNEVQKF